MKFSDHFFLLRLAVIIILLMHSVPGMFNNGITEFGKFYLNEVGFSPVGVLLAWSIKLSHVVCALCLILNRFVIPTVIVTIIVLVMGIVMVHFKEGWYVVGGGRNGIEFNFLLICVLITLIYPQGIKKSSIPKAL